MCVNSNTCLLSIILTKSVFHIMSIFSIYHLICQLFRRNLFSRSSMPVSLNQYQGAVGVLNSKCFIDKKHISFSNNPFPFSVNLTKFDCFSIILTSSYTYFVLIFFFLLNFVKYNFKINSPKNIVWNLTFFYIYLFWLVSIFLNRSGDNPGPKTKSGQNFSVCHWNLNSVSNLNSISGRSFSKISLLQANNAIHNYDIICFSETYVNSSIPYDDDNLEIPGYNLIHADHPPEDNHISVCV